jgi:hypothetical protein
VIGQIALGALNLVLQHLGMRKMLKQRDNVGKRFVERQDIEIAGLCKTGMQPVEKGMRHLVGDMSGGVPLISG